jgi:hypothetical protein
MFLKLLTLWLINNTRVFSSSPRTARTNSQVMPVKQQQQSINTAPKNVDNISIDTELDEAVKFHFIFVFVCLLIPHNHSLSRLNKLKVMVVFV